MREKRSSKKGRGEEVRGEAVREKRDKREEEEE